MCAINLAAMSGAQKVDHIRPEIEAVDDAIVSASKPKVPAALQSLVRIMRQRRRKFVNFPIDSPPHARRQSEIDRVKIPRKDLLRRQRHLRRNITHAYLTSRDLFLSPSNLLFEFLPQFESFLPNLIQTFQQFVLFGFAQRAKSRFDFLRGIHVQKIDVHRGRASLIRGPITLLPRRFPSPIPRQAQARSRSPPARRN